MALNTIADIRKSLNGGGARPNLFEVDIPENSLFKYVGSDSQLDSRVLVKAGPTSCIERCFNRRSFQRKNHEGCR